MCVGEMVNFQNKNCFQNLINFTRKIKTELVMGMTTVGIIDLRSKADISCVL